MKLNEIGRAGRVFARLHLQTLCVTNRIHFWIRRSADARQAPGSSAAWSAASERARSDDSADPVHYLSDPPANLTQFK